MALIFNPDADWWASDGIIGQQTWPGFHQNRCIKYLTSRRMSMPYGVLPVIFCFTTAPIAANIIKQ